MSDKKVKLECRVSQAVKDKVIAKAEEENRNYSEVVRSAVTVYLDGKADLLPKQCVRIIQLMDIYLNIISSKSMNESEKFKNLKDCEDALKKEMGNFICLM